MRKEEDEDQRVRNLFREITKLLPERSKIKTDLLYFKYAPILVMLFRWYSVSQFYDSKMEITLWYEENEEPIWFFYFITYILYPISLWKGQVLHRLCVEWRIPLLSAVAQAEGKPIPCGLSEGDMELVALLTAMMNDTQANKGWCAHEMGKSISSFEKYVHDGKIPEGIHDQFGHEKKWNKSLIRYFANKKAFFRKLSRKYGINL